LKLVEMDYPTSKIPAVNVATVPQRSPLRYPGGKTWLIPHIRAWLTMANANVIIEPFAGGGVVSLTAVMEGFVEKAILVEIDRDVAAFWHAALRRGTELANAVQNFRPTRRQLSMIEKAGPSDILELGFRTLVLNRTRNSGILAPGASFTRNGENGKGILSRWYPDTLANRLAAIDEYADRITFCEADGVELLDPLLYGWGSKAAVFLDPPYTVGGKRAGARLYAHAEVDHERLFEILSKRKCNFLMTYDQSSEIEDLIEHHGFSAVTVQMKNAHHNRMAELLITREPLFA
jgi:DNA adenine methylase